MRRGDADRRNVSAKLLRPKNSAATQSTADVKYVSAKRGFRAPDLSGIAQGTLLSIDQALTQHRSAGTRGRRPIDEASMVVHARPRPVTAQNLPRLPLVICDQLFHPGTRRQHQRSKTE